MPLRHPETLIRIETEVQLCRGAGGNREHLWELRITDRASHAVILELQLDEKDISNLISARTVVAKGILSKAPVIGKTMEVRQVTVRLPEGKTRTTVAAALAAGEKLAPAAEGWEFDEPDVDNFHRYKREKNVSHFSMVARRYV